MRVGLIGCGKEKLKHPAPASELYVGSFFKLCKQWITKPGRVDEWGILSAKHGLVMPDDVYEPYDQSLWGLTTSERRAWAVMVRGQIVAEWGRENIFMILAGAHYRMAVSELPMVEDVIAHWTSQRQLSGMRRPQMGMGVIKKYMKNDEGFGA